MSAPAPVARITRLDNGLVVATERVPGALSVAIGAWVGVGGRDEPEPLIGVSHFLEHLAFKGTTTRTAQEISRSVDRYGGDLNAFTSKEYTAYYCRLPAARLAFGVDLVGDVVSRPALRDADVETERQVILEELAMDDDEPEDVAYRLLGEALYPAHPLGWETAGTRETVGAITAEDLRCFHDERYLAGRTVVSVVGDVDHDDVAAQVGAAFDGLGAGGDRPPRRAPGDAGAATIAHDDDTEQVQLLVGLRAFGREDEDREAFEVLVQVLGGGTSSRLFEEIREQRGLAYSVYAGSALFDDAGSLSIYAGTQPEHLDEVRSLVLREVEQLRRDGVTEDELEVARGYLTGSFVLGLEDTGSRMARLGSQLVASGRLRSVEEQVRRWDAVTRADVMRVAERVLGGPIVEVTVGPR